MYRLLKMVTFFGKKPASVQRVAHFNVSPSNAFELCKNYEEFLKVMLGGVEGPYNGKWAKGGPGEVGAVYEYGLKRDGMYNTIKEELIEMVSYKELDVHRISWSNVGSDPWLPLKGYESHFELQPCEKPSNGEPYDGPLCRLVWTQTFRPPRIFGIIPLTNIIKRSLNGTASVITNFTFRQYFTQEFPVGGKSLPKKADRVAVIGAGPSGLHMAHVLRNKLGIKDITILERSKRFGGKTVTIDSQTHPGEVVHELGTCYLHPAYFAVRAYMQELKQMMRAMGPGHTPEGFAEEVDPITYDIESLGKENCTLEDWVMSNLKAQKAKWSIMSFFRIVLPKAETALELYHAKTKYNRLHREIFGVYDFSMPPRLSKENMAKIDMSFGQFLATHGLTALNPILAYGNTAQGYGTIANVPAFWAMCWITPELMDGYFRLPEQSPARKAMFKKGWRTMWEATMKVNQFNVEYNTDIHSIKRDDAGNNGAGLVTITGEQDGVEFDREFDYLVVAAPMHDGQLLPEDEVEWSIRDGIKDKLVPLDMTPEEQLVLRSEHLTHSQFRTLLFKLEAPQPYLYSHLKMYADKVLGSGTGNANVFASRDSYLALNPDYCTLDGHQNDPQKGMLREQMAYQWVESGRNLPLKHFNEKFAEWSKSAMGLHGQAYSLMKEQHWNYFQRYDNEGLNKFLPWKVLELQGKHNTMFVHASTFFESVLDIINYNHMIIDGLSGKLNSITSPPRFEYKPIGEPGAIPESERVPIRWLRKPLNYETDHWRIVYNPVTKVFLRCLDLVLNTVWTLLYIPLYPILSLTVIPRQRYVTQAQFKTPNLGSWWQYSMSKFLAVSPSVVSYNNEAANRKNGNNNLETYDLIMKISREILERDYPDIPKVPKAMMLGYNDYRIVMRVWMGQIKPTFLGFVGPRSTRALQWLSYTFPVGYSYVTSWICIFAFNFLTGFAIRREDGQGGGAYIPHCHMLDVARKEYGDELGTKICTHICKIFSEEAMAMKGIAIEFEPNFVDGSCWVRPTSPRLIAYHDHSLFNGMQVSPTLNNPEYKPTVGK